MYTYQKNNRYFAQLPEEFKELAEAELTELGAYDVSPAYRGLHFSAAQEAVYRIVYSARLLTRVLAPLMVFDCHSDRYLYKTVRNIEWNRIIGVDGTFAINANVSDSHITHSKYAALKMKDAIVDQFRDATGQRPSIDTKNPDVQLNLHIHRNRATIHLDLGGASLHKRGYRVDSVEAPLQETLAAAMLKLSGWDGERPLVDPMCGSGTILAEALMSYCRIPAGYLRPHFGFENLPDFSLKAWQDVKAEMDAQLRELPQNLISGSDISAKSIQAARANLDRLPGGRNVRLSARPFQEIDGIDNSTILTNPPYGLRIGGSSTGDLIKAFGDFMKQRCTGSTAYIYLGRRELIKQVGLRAAFKKPLKNGQLDGRLVKYELY